MTDTQTIKDRLDIVQFIQEYVPLKKNGANWKANCPFHQEKSPSFMVHPEKQIWHCFGCGKGGDIFSFLQEIEGLEFSEALKLLANRAGVELTLQSSSEINSNQKNRILEINKNAAYFFYHFLVDLPQSKSAKQYLDQRGVKKETLFNWQIGYIGDQWDLLTRYLLKKGYSHTDLIAAGLTIQHENSASSSVKRFYDRFRGRIMFPINDVHGNVVGFTGRILVESERSQGKYVNTPQTLAYDKSRILYGLDKAKISIKKKDIAILVEGQFDVISSHQIGISNVIAASGTALTIEQIKLIKRYTSNIAIAFDADLAGQNAGKRGIELALEQGLRVKVIQIPKEYGKDADECIKKDPKIWVAATENAVEVMEWYFKTTFEKYLNPTAQNKQIIAQILLTQISYLSSPIERDHWTHMLAERLQTDRVVLREELKTIKKTINKDKIFTPKNNFTKKVELNSNELNQYHYLLQAFWALVNKFPQFYSDYQPLLKEVYFDNTVFSSLYEFWQRYYNNGKIELENLYKSLSKPNSQNIIDLLVLQGEKDYSHLSGKEAFLEGKKILNRIEEMWIKNKRKEIEFLIREAEKKKDDVLLKNLLKQIQAL